MKKNVLIFGGIAGLWITAMSIYTTTACYTNPDWQSNDLMGYAGMLAAFSFIYVGIRNYRDKFNGGVITFGKAFKAGLYITLVAATMTVVVWLFEYYLFMPDFLDKYIPHAMKQAALDGATAQELEIKSQELADYKAMYQNPVVVVLFSYLEIVPVGLIISVIAALLLKRKTQPTASS